MNKDELQLLRELSESHEWEFIRTRLLDYCSEQSGNDIFFKEYARGVLYAIRIVDGWAKSYYELIKRDKEEKGEL